MSKKTYYVFVRDGERAHGRLESQAEANAWRCVHTGLKRDAMQIAQYRTEQCVRVFGRIKMVWER